MYEVLITKPIFEDADETNIYESLEKYVELPFVPFIGLEVRWPGFRSGPIEAIQWHHKHERFVAITRAVTPGKDNFSRQDDPNLVARHIAKEQGWDRGE